MSDNCLVIHPQKLWDSEQSRNPSARLEEAVGLAEAIHLDVIEARIFQLKKATPKTLIGAGQAKNCRNLIEAEDISITIVDTELSPTQQRNLERDLNCKVIDRTALILEIFGERAQTAEGKLQVELAALNYQKSRLVRSWTHLERQRGGAGFMGGPGETQIETDRRLIAERITKIKKQLSGVTRTRELHRKTRRDTPYPLVALAGYTNAGKSTLFNRLGGADVMAKDMLFATLDPTIRAIDLDNNTKVLLSDTVGFISHLPHELIAAFRATLEEVAEADILIHVRDISHPDTETQKADVEQVLSELLGDEWSNKPLIEVWNKCDLLESDSSESDGESPLSGQTDCITLSALNGDGCDTLIKRISDTLYDLHYKDYHYKLPLEAGKAAAWLYRHGHVLHRHDGESHSIIDVRLTPANAAKFEQIVLKAGA